MTRDVLERADEWIRACGPLEPDEVGKVPGLALIIDLAAEVRELRKGRDGTPPVLGAP